MRCSGLKTAAKRGKITSVKTQRGGAGDPEGEVQGCRAVWQRHLGCRAGVCLHLALLWCVEAVPRGFLGNTSALWGWSFPEMASGSAGGGRGWTRGCPLGLSGQRGALVGSCCLLPRKPLLWLPARHRNSGLSLCRSRKIQIRNIPPHLQWEVRSTTLALCPLQAPMWSSVYLPVIPAGRWGGLGSFLLLSSGLSGVMGCGWVKVIELLGRGGLEMALRSRGVLLEMAHPKTDFGRRSGVEQVLSPDGSCPALPTFCSLPRCWMVSWLSMGQWRM